MAEPASVSSACSKLCSTSAVAVTGVLTYWRTVRHLKPVQVYGRLRFRIARPHADMAPPPALRPRAGTWALPARRRQSLTAPASFRFLNEEHDLAAGWDDPALEKLWRYNLHYFDDLNANGAAERAAWHSALLSRWVRENVPGVGIGWEPYPTSLRIVNWIKWQLNGNTLSAECVHSLAVQARWLTRRLEAHLLGNHLFANAKALIFAGSFFEGAEADAWLAIGTRVLQREIPEQILSDGAQFELSPMYHALALEDLLDLVNLASAYRDTAPALARFETALSAERVGAMRAWLAAMSHPDGSIGLFNDAAEGIAPTIAELEDYAARLGLPNDATPHGAITELKASGYIRLERPAVVALLDVGRVGPDYLPAHAHADNLSFELSLFGQRVFVNSGTSRYGTGAERLRQRGTAAHNTVIVDSRDSSEVWGGFRVGRRAEPIGLRVTPGARIVVRCAHDGYAHRPARVIHTRIWTLAGDTLSIEDTLSGSFAHAQARYHLHPSVSARPSAEAPANAVQLTLPGGQAIDVSVTGGGVRIEPTTWHPEFGMSESAFCLVVDFAATAVCTRLRWSVPA